jgi:hypothetical protein
MAATQTEYQTGFAADIAPYGKDVLGKFAALTAQPYQAYKGQRTAGLSALQQQAMQQAAALGYNPYSTAGATGTQSLAAQAAAYKYAPSSFNYTKAVAPTLQNYQMTGPANVAAQNVNAGNISAAQMGPAQQVSTGAFTAPGTVAQYMSPYQQSVTDIAKREAQRQADIAGTQRGAHAAQAGAFGGSRQAIENAEAQRNLSQQMGDIQAKGSQDAYNQAAQMFTSDQARQLAAQQANQQAGLTVGTQNLTAQQQTNVQNIANQLQASGMNAQQALQAALANQQIGYNVGNQNLQANLGTQQLGSAQNIQTQLANQAANQQTQQLGEQSKQYGAGLGLQGLQAGMQGYNQLGTMGQNLYGQNLGNIGVQQQLGSIQQQTDQASKQAQYEDFLRQQQYPYQQLSMMSDAVRGAPMTQQSSTVFTPNPSLISQIGGLATAGLGAYGLYNNAFGGQTAPGKARGGVVRSYAKGGLVKAGRQPAGLSAIVISRIG